MTFRRLVTGLVLATGALLVIGTLGLWIVLARWVPVSGKARVIQEIEQRWPVSITIGRMRYGLFRGITLEVVQVTRTDTNEPVTMIPEMQVHINRLALLRRQIAFSGRVDVIEPFPTRVMLAGVYTLQHRTLKLDVQTGDIALGTVTAPLAQHIPHAIGSGQVRFRLRLLQAPEGRPEVSGRITATALAWNGPGWRMSGDLLFDGKAIPHAHSDGRWAVDGRLRLTRGRLDGVPLAGPVTDLQGTAHVTEDGMQIEQLSGAILESLWTLEGSAAFRPLTAEALIAARQQLAPLSSALGAPYNEWHAEGLAGLQTVCRAAFGVSRMVDCLVRVDTRGASLKGPKLAEPVTGIEGSLSADVLTNAIAIESFSGTLRGHPLSVKGTVDARGPVRLALNVQGGIPLDVLEPWLAPASPVSALKGEARFDLDITGTGQDLRPTGSIDLVEAGAALRAPAAVIEEARAAITLTAEDVRVREADFRLNGRPVALQGSVSRHAEPAVSAAVRMPEGELTLDARVGRELVTVEQAVISLAKSRVTIEGRVARHRGRASALSVSGRVDSTDLTALPFLPLPALESWALKGSADVQADYQGDLTDWRTAAIRARIRSDYLEARRLPLEHLQATIEQRDRVLRVELPSALFSDGKLSGELQITHAGPQRQDFRLEGDLIGMALDRLTEVIPAWRDRAVTGRASTHTSLSGVWQAKHSWQGEGWMKAEGERLGNVPLLDKVFRGLFGVLADRLGLDTLRRVQITNVTGRWQMAKERIQTDDLRLAGVSGSEPVAVYARGSVGLDRTLDFVIEPELSEGVLLESPTTSTLARTVLQSADLVERFRRLIGRHRLTGTLDEPVYRFEYSTQEVFRQLAPGPADILQHLFETVR
jgi:hypothetical protein